MRQRTLQERPRIAAVNEPHLACVLLLDTSGSMARSIDNLNNAINDFKKAVSMDELSKKRVDVAIVEFNDEATVIQEFTPISEMEPIKLTAGGLTAMGEGINLAIDLVRERSRFYRDIGIGCFRPWIFMITDGVPTDDIAYARSRIAEEESKGEYGKLKFFAVGVDNYDKDAMFMLTPRVIELKEANFEGIFNWMSESMICISASTVSDEAELPMLPEDARKADPSRDVSDW